MIFSRKKKYNSLEDLVIGCQQSEPRAQHDLYERYKGRMLAICLRYARTEAEAEDIFQDAFIKVFKNIQEIKDIHATDAWVKAIVIRTAINYYQRTTKNESLKISFEDTEQLLESQDYERIISQMDLDMLLKTISSLPNGYRTVINLHLIDGYSHGEIAEMLSISEGTSKSQYRRGKNLLIKKLQQQGIFQND